MNEIPYKISTPVDTSSTPETYLRQRDFDSLIQKKGYPCYLDRFMPCPCKEKGVESAKLTCQNCYGSGFVLVERVQTKAYFASMNFPTQYKDYSIENTGEVQITTMSTTPVNFMDRFVLYNERNIYSEIIYPLKLDSGEIISFCAYPPVEILQCKVYQGDNLPLKDLDISKIQIDQEGKLILTKLKEDLVSRDIFVYENTTGISIRYKYIPTYHVIDISHNLRVSETDTFSSGNGNKGDRVQFPYSAIGRMSHLVLDRGNLFSLPKGTLSNTNYQNENAINQQSKLSVSKEFCDTENIH